LKICIVYQGSDLNERLYKVARSLSQDSHRVLLLCNNDGTTRTASNEWGNVDIERVGPTFANRRINRILKFPIFCNPLWIVQLANAVRRLGADAIHVVDIPLAPAALLIGWLFRIPVVLDMWENYPEALRIWAETDWTTRIFKNYRVARVVERFTTRSVDRIITVVEEQKERLIGEGISAEHVSVVTNAFDSDLFSAQSGPVKTPLAEDSGAYKLLYIGAITRERGLEDIIRAMPAVLRRISQARLYIAGPGNYIPRLRSLAEELGVGERVRFTGMVPFAEIRTYIEQSDLCLVPHIYSGFINTTIPNKLFQYMALEKPVLVSNAKPLARIVNESRCGLVFRSGDAADAADKIIRLYESPATAEMARRGSQTVRERYLWKHAAPALLAIYAGLDRERRGKKAAASAAV
jgi:glycosyltransferase involved in cell wall biosynthesis